MKEMTIGTLSRRTGVPVKALREYEDMGLIYTVGRSSGNYRLFGDDALWCVAAIRTMRGLGLTLAEIRELAGTYLQRRKDPFGPTFANLLRSVRARTKERIIELQELLERLDEFEAEHRAELDGVVRFDLGDPHAREGA